MSAQHTTKRSPFRTQGPKVNDLFNGYGSNVSEGASATKSVKLSRPKLKQLFDSSYVRPDENERVTQNMHKQEVAWNIALKRYEDEVKNKGKRDEQTL